MKSASVTKQEEPHQQAESSRNKYILELKEMCQRVIDLLQQNDFVHPESRLKLNQAMEYLDDPDCNKSTEKSLCSHILKFIKQCNKRVKEKPLFQSINPQSSAIPLQDSNMRIFGDNSMQYPSKLVISQQDDTKSEQHMCESNSVNLVQQVSMRSLQLPSSTLPQPNDIKFLSKNHRNELVRANSRSSSVAQRLDPKQKKALHHVSAQKKKQEYQQRQMCQQFIKGNQEVPQQLQQDHEMPHQLNEVDEVKMTQGIEHETALNQRPEVNSLKFRQPGFSRKFLSSDSSSLKSDDRGFDASTINFGESSHAEQPILRLIKAVNSISSKALTASVSEFGSVVNLADSMAGSVPVYGSQGSVSERFRGHE
ncbi:hypothetical protein OIU74_013547 [Salix koriyanagi]|uniref:Uncharacterized protein n=1 Tax=Salix koriyanagi TaxID=2511006 RepID=A0A9Q0Q9Q3_9ROSI|nr:hypothetical protein OIU74_013547 [Salix koriyanagi]